MKTSAEILPCCFHPTMVRFKAGPLSPLMPQSRVSIPLWWDLKRTCPSATAPLEPVSIPLWCDLKHRMAPRPYLTPAGFHPTMVRFKGVHGTGVCRRAPPGFHPTMVRFKAVLAGHLQPDILMVSIPLWCDLKTGEPHWSHQWLIVSIPLWCDLKPGSSCATPPRCEVSIPLWCDLK